MYALRRKIFRWAKDFCRRHRVAAFGWDVVLVFLDRRVTRSAAELAYYLLLTLFPMIIMVVGIVGLLPLEPKEVMAFIKSLIPSTSASLVAGYITYVLRNQSGTLFTAGLVSTLMAASAAFRGLVCISGEIYGRRAYRGFRFWLISFLFSAVLIVMIYLSLVVVFTGGWFMKLVESHMAFDWIPDNWPTIRLVCLFSVALVFLMILYRVTSPRGTVHPPVFLGALITAGVLTGLSSAFSAFVSLSSRYSVVYGSLASMILLMLWLYLCGNVVILGNVFNYVWWRHRRGLPIAIILERKL